MSTIDQPRIPILQLSIISLRFDHSMMPFRDDTSKRSRVVMLTKQPDKLKKSQIDTAENNAILSMPRNAVDTPSTSPTRLNCRVTSRRRQRCAPTSQLADDD